MTDDYECDVCGTINCSYHGPPKRCATCRHHGRFVRAHRLSVCERITQRRRSDEPTLDARAGTPGVVELLTPPDFGCALRNVVPACYLCNMVKAAKEPLGWLARTGRLPGFIERVAAALARMEAKTPTI